jgi:pimeloyl-ACP methyl ester carboxylesterase
VIARLHWKPMPAPIEHLHVEANGINFHVAVSGEEGASSILCLHGFPEGSMSWRPVMQALTNRRVYAPDLRGYPGTTYAKDGYDVITLTDDIRALIEALALDKPLLVSHDWGGALGWIFAHRYSSLIRGLVVVNCPHPRTLVRAILRFEDLQTVRVPWLPFFQIPWFPEFLMATLLGRRLLRFSFTVREGRPGAMDVALVDELVGRFRRTRDMHGPVEYYRQIARTYVLPKRRAELQAIYDRPISVPVTLVWGEEDGALSAKVARKSDRDAGCPVDWRPLPGTGHFVSLEAAEDLAREMARADSAA